MTQICTTIEQSKKLLEAGLNSETADMFYNPTMNIDNGNCAGFLDIPECIPFNEIKEHKELYMPGWSLTALLHQLPFPELWQEMLAGMLVWKCKLTFFEDDVTYTSEIYNTEIEAVLDCVLWTLKNKNKNYV